MDYSSLSGGEANSMYKFLCEQASRNMVDVGRRGGSNGRVDNMDPATLRRFLHYPGSAPRNANACKWLLRGERLTVVYITPYQDTPTAKSYTYPIPFRASQMTWTCKKIHDFNQLGPGPKRALLMFVQSKLLSALIFRETNRIVSRNGWVSMLPADFKAPKGKHKSPLLDWLRREPRSLIASEATDMEYKRITALSNSFPGDNEFVAYESLRGSLTTMMGDAVAGHRDVSAKHPTSGTRTPFIENKMVFCVPCMSTGDKLDPPLGRGGLGPGQFVFARK